jgi:hypothetical protein
MGTKSTIEQLNSFLRGEMSAVETYQMALEKIDEVSTLRDELLANLKSHQDRVMMLQDAVLACGGTPATSSGPWGMVAKVVEGSARLLGEKAAIVALEEGEAHGLSEYRSDLDALDAQTRELVESELLPAQEHTHERLSALEKRV